VVYQLPAHPGDWREGFTLEGVKMATIRARKIAGIAYDVKCCIAGKDEQFTGNKQS